MTSAFIDDLPEESEAPSGKPLVRLVEPGESVPSEREREEATCRYNHYELAEIWVRRHGRDWKFIQTRQRWMWWNGSRWEEDQIRRMNHEVKEFLRQASCWRAAAELSATQKKEVLSNPFAGNIRETIKNTLSINASIEEWDRNDWLLGVPGGVVDLKSGQFRFGQREDFVSMSAAVQPEFSKSKVLTEFLESVLPGRSDVHAYIQRFVGYALTGDCREEMLLFTIGEGQNGKGTLLKAVADIMGSYALRIKESTLMLQTGNTHSSEIAVTRGRRLIYVDETKTSSVWDEGRIKELTGGSKISAALKYHDDEEFQPKGKLWVVGNTKPKISGGGKSIERRLHTLKFPIKFTMEQRDNTLKARMTAEYPKILGWMIEGCLAWQKEGLNPPKDIIEATSDYLSSNDVMGEWIEDCTNNGGSMNPKEAYKSYKSWVADRDEEHAWSRGTFMSKLDERGYPYKRTSVSRLIQGLSLKTSQSHWADKDD